MAVPNLQHVVQAVRDSQPWDFSTKEGLCAYGNAVVVALHAADPAFGHLLKDPGQTHCVDPDGRLCAVDVALHKPTGTVVDFILSAGVGSENKVVWGPGPAGEYGPDRWFAPIPNSGTPVPDPGTPQPADGLELRVKLLETRMAIAIEMASAALKETAITKQRAEAINDRLIAVDAAAIKELPEYVGSGRVGFWGGSFTVTSRPKT